MPKPDRKKHKTSPVVQFLYEAGLLKAVARSGWTVAGMRHAETVAEHCFRCAVVGYVLACLEKADTAKVVLMTLFNDFHEARINDLHKISQQYYDGHPQAEQRAFRDQICRLPMSIRQPLASMQREYLGQQTQESLISRDADILECLLQAKEYYEQGYRQARHFMRKAPRYLVSRSAKNLWQAIKKSRSDDWWQAVSTFRR